MTSIRRSHGTSRWWQLFRKIHLPRTSTILGTALQRRFEQTRSIDDLNRAITLHEGAVAVTPNDHSDYSTYLSHLSSALRSRFDKTGSVDDLYQAIAAIEQAAK
jgi:hypothetical protein